MQSPLDWLRNRGTGGGVSGARITRLLALLLVMAMVAAACAGDDSTDTTEGDDGGGSDTTADGGGGDGEGVELLVWVTRPYYIPPDEFASFTEETGVTVTYDVQSNDDILQQLLTRVDAGQPLPDVLGAEDAFLIENYVEAGLIESHDEIAATWEAEAPEQYELLFPLAWDETSIDGTKYGLSVTANFDVLYYDPEWLAEAGVTVPFESLDAVLDGLRAMKASRPDSIPFTVQAIAGEGVTTLKTVLAAAGAPFDGAVPDLESEGGIYTINWFLQAAAEGLLPPEAIAWGEDESRGAFVSRAAGMILDGFTTAGDFNEATDFAYPDQWDLTPVPLSRSGGGDDGVALSAARTWAVLAGTEHPDEAALVLRYIAETDNLIEAAGNGSVPMRQTEAFESPELLEIWPFFNDDLKAAYLGSSPTPAGPNAGEVEGILEQMFGEIVVGTDKTAEELAAEYQALLDEA
ncbi:MAG TPA: extracellular solute-binding protein [Acidimicrobiia bacterium]|nr:extracellular solute-binding protein [Acidimicrobiia bacterium]